MWDHIISEMPCVSKRALCTQHYPGGKEERIVRCTMVSSSLYAGQLLLLPILAATSYCSTAAVCCPVSLRRDPLRQVADACLSTLRLQPWHGLPSQQHPAHRSIDR